VQFQRLTADATGHRCARVDDPLAFVSGASFTGEGDRMDDELIALAPNVWLLPCDDDADAGRVQPAVGIVCSATQTVLVDAGNGPAHARRIRAALDRIAAPPLRCVIYTHHHPDHVFGAQLFGVPAIAHELGRALVAELAARSWSREALARRPGLWSFPRRCATPSATTRSRRACPRSPSRSACGCTWTG
jgi:hypothetical protein